MQNNIIIWETSIAEMFHNGHFGGIAVQMKFWGEALINKGYKVHSLTYRSDFVCNEFHFHSVPNIRSLNILLECIYAFKLIRKLKPRYVLMRGAHRALLPLSIVAKIFKTDVIFFGASDMNFIPGKASVGNTINRKMYEKGLCKVPFIVTQNDFQKEKLLSYFNRESICIPNIWNLPSVHKNEPKCYDVVWIGNLRRLKRAEWVIELARQIPGLRFVIAGAPNDLEYYNEIKQQADKLINLDFLGPISFDKTNEIVRKSNLLICTSEYEGFPNTFLQAWAAGLPVISTVNPNDIFDKYEIGVYCKNYSEILNAVTRLTSDIEVYSRITRNIVNYFENGHSPSQALSRLLEYTDRI